MKRFGSVLSLLVATTGAAPASTTWYVDDDALPNGNGSQQAPFQAIGEAFAVVAAGDTISIADGLYVGASNRRLFFDGALHVRGSGSADCIIDCDFEGRAFDFEHAGSTTTLEGLTIRNGDGRGADVFTNGGGLRVLGSAVVRDVHFVGCRGSAGGAFFQSGGTLDFERVEVRDCIAGTAGGAGWGAGRMVDCTFANNRALASFSGALHLRGDTELLRCRFENNDAQTLAGAVCVASGNLSISHCEFQGNRAQNGGAVQSKTQSVVRMSNSLFVGNEAEVGNGGAYIGAGTLEMTQCTVVGNHANDKGGGVRYLISEEATFSNCVFWGNTANEGDQLSLGYSENPSLARVRFSNFEGGAAAVHVGQGSQLLWEQGNLDVDPRFRDPQGGDYRLEPTSPCVHRGSNADVPADFLDVDGDGDTSEPMPLDLDGNARIARLVVGFSSILPPFAVVDMGAYEAQ